MSIPAEKKPESSNRKHFSWLQRTYIFLSDIITSFVEDGCYTKASALAFYSLLSTVPILAVLFGIARGFGLGNTIESEISHFLFQEPELSDKLIEFAYSQLQSVRGGLIAGVGSLVLLWSVTSLLNTVESTFNEIWKIKTGRSLLRKIQDYLAIFFIAPFFVVASSSINIFLNAQVTERAQSNVFVNVVSPILLFILSFFPFFLISVLFVFIYAFMPNTRIYWREAIVAGAIAGTAFQLWQWVYIQFQIGISSYGAIYGSFAAIPLFMLWLQVSWMIILAGAEIAVEVENGLFLPNRKPRFLSVKNAALLIVFSCIDAFVRGAPPYTERLLARKLGISHKNIHRILEALSKYRILSRAYLGENAFGYQPARSVQDITVKLIFESIEKSYEFQAYVEDVKELEKIEALISSMDKSAFDFVGSKSLYSILSE